MCANLDGGNTSFICVRYGNVLASRGSVIPLFHDQIRNGGPVTITTPDMTRFLLSLEEAVETVIYAVKHGLPGETFIPRVPSALVTNVAKALIGTRPIEIKITGIRPGEKVHEILVSEEEAHRTVERGKYYVIQSMLPEVCEVTAAGGRVEHEYSSGDEVMSLEDTVALLKRERLMMEDVAYETQETLR